MYRYKKLYTSKIVALALCFSLIGFTPLVSNAQATQIELDESNFRSVEDYRLYLYTKLVALQAQLVALLNLQSQMEEDEKGSGKVSSGKFSNDRIEPNPHFMQVNTMAPLSIGRSTAKLAAEVDKGSATDSEVWFEYGVSKSLNKKSKAQNITRSRKSNFSIDVFDLKSNTTYSYRAVVADQDGNRQYGQTRTFSTPASATTVSFSGSPLVETDGVANVRSNSVELRGFVSMNDFEDGILFFTYGSDRSAINNTEDFDDYESVPTERGVTGKKVMNRQFTGRDIVGQRVSGLKRATKYYYNVCVEYRDNGTKIRCSETESFVTLN